MREVVITGMGAVCCLGATTESMFDGLKKGLSGVQRMPDWQQYVGLKTQVAAPAAPYDSKLIPRQARRTMSAMSEMALLASKEAMLQAGIENLNGKRAVIIMGSTTGSPPTFEQYFRRYHERHGPEGQLSTSFFKVMNHSVAANVSVGLGYNGPQLAVASACSTASQAAVVGWELISAGFYDLALIGGADELHHTSAAIFDNVHAASKAYNDQPEATPRPFDRDRDGLAVSEGSGIVVLEAKEHATKRQAKPLAKMLGGAYYCNGTHMTQPQVEGMVDTMRQAMQRANLTPDQVEYCNAHGTGTLMGDVNEARATSEFLGSKVPVSSLKGHLGHTLAACGGLEMIATIKMMQEGILIPTRNLANIDPEASSIEHVQSLTETTIRTAMSNNFAFGGMNATVILSTKGL